MYVRGVPALTIADDGQDLVEILEIFLDGRDGVERLRLGLSKRVCDQ